MAAGDFIGWGTWTTGTKNGSAVGDLSYVVGRPTAVMPGTGTAVGYATIVGKTPVSAYDTSLNAAIASGTLNSASLTVNFGTSQITTLAIGTSFGGFTVTTPISISGSQFSYSNSIPLYKVDGFFSGVNAARAGMVYTGTNGNTQYSGAVVLAP